MRQYGATFGLGLLFILAELFVIPRLTGGVLLPLNEALFPLAVFVIMMAAGFLIVLFERRKANTGSV